MTAKRLYYVLLGVIGLLVIGLILGAQSADSVLNKHAATLSKLKAKQQAADYEQKRLVKAQQAIQQYADLEKIAKVVVPEDKDQAEAVRELINFANKDHISIGSITFPTSTLGATVTNGSSASSSTTTTTNTVPVTPKFQAPDSPANKLSQLLAIPGLPGVYQLSITVTTTTGKPASFENIITFLQDLEGNRRTAQVTTIHLEPDSIDPTLLNLTLNINEYIKP